MTENKMDKLGTLKLNKIHQGDCIELLKKIPDNSIDLIFADPPYNLQLNGELFRPNQTKVDAVNDSWDKFESKEEYDKFTTLWMKECHRVLKNSGSFWVIGTYHNIFRVGAILQNIGFWMLNDIIWIKTNPMPNFKGTRFNNAHETLIWATKSKSSNYTFHYHSMKVMNDDLQMRSDWLIPICQGEERIKVNGQKAHSTQKPAELLYRIIISTSNPGDIVLDPFSGSGTTAAVAKRLGRKFIAFDREEFYVKIGTERVEKIKPIEKPLLEYKIEKRKPKVPFGNLIEKGFVKIGEYLYSKDGKFSAQVLADSSLEGNGIVGSIHKVSASFLRKENHNGWTFWYVKRNNTLISIDQLRHDYENKYLKSSDKYNELEFERNSAVNEPEESFLIYGNNEL
ncbi:site-specific DNA-methyltransferase [Ignavibacterium album]|jgi:DNA modification methylase|uniref:site-specific DNA-methyltransferase n=1 Tax=Ignavibacterium album TaxID=591197 RepID=UPI0017C7FF61|nr:site-specific DNA-methyltransferase [Bacteroidales bacterium]